MITADQLVAHAVGDYILQSDWMATTKTKKTVAALAHVATYTLPFLFLTRSLAALAAILGTHLLIDRWRLARYVVWAKNFIAPPRIKHESQRGPTAVGSDVPFNAVQYGFIWTWYTRRNPPWKDCAATGYPPDVPPWMAVWLLIIADNTMHVLCNALALRYL